MIETVAPGAMVLGADLGGTSTRVLVAAADDDRPGTPLGIRLGTRLGSGRGGPGNPVSSPALAAGSLSTAVRAALDGLPADRVVRAVLGVAGGSALASGPRREEFDAALREAGLVVAPEYVGDVEVAFAAGTAAADGAVLVAGTGASAGRIEGGRLVRTAAGHGWLLGDDGSGYWLGREAVRAALDALDAGDLPDGLARAALDHLAGLAGSDLRAPLGAVDEAGRRRWKQLVVRVVSDRPPVRLADLARLVTDGAEVGDPVALDLVERAGEALVRPLLPLLDDDEPLVLAGGLARSGRGGRRRRRARAAPARRHAPGAAGRARARPGRSGARSAWPGRPTRSPVRSGCASACPPDRSSTSR